jgi:hypothetical protein
MLTALLFAALAQTAPPPDLQVDEGEIFALAVSVTSLEGGASPAYRRVTISVRYDRARLCPTLCKLAPGAPGVLSPPTQTDVDGAGAGTIFQMTLIYDAGADTNRVGRIAELGFQAFDLKAGENTATTEVTWDTAYTVARKNNDAGLRPDLKVKNKVVIGKVTRIGLEAEFVRPAAA